MQRFWIEFSVMAENGESSVEVVIPVAAESMAAAQDIWEALLEVLPAGRVGGGVLTEEEHEAYVAG